MSTSLKKLALPEQENKFLPLSLSLTLSVFLFAQIRKLQPQSSQHEARSYGSTRTEKNAVLYKTFIYFFFFFSKLLFYRSCLNFSSPILLGLWFIYTRFEVIPIFFGTPSKNCSFSKVSYYYVFRNLMKTVKSQHIIGIGSLCVTLGEKQTSYVQLIHLTSALLALTEVNDSQKTSLASY